MTDHIPPSAPTGLASFLVTKTDMTISWIASTDNVGVTGYSIFRNGVQVGTSSSTLFADTGLVPSTLYSYTVSAFDAAGNNSAQSAALPVATLSSDPLRFLPFIIGQKYFFRTIACFIIGEPSSVVGDFLVLRNARWVADTGHFSNEVAINLFVDVRPLLLPAYLNIVAITDAFLL